MTAELQGREVFIPEAGDRFLLSEVVAYPEVGSRYRNIRTLQPGQVWIFPLYLRGVHSCQALIAAKGESETGTCVWVKRASYYDGDKGRFRKFRSERDFTDYLETDDWEVWQLGFTDDSDMLRLIRTELVMDPSDAEENINPDDAEAYLDQFLD